MSADVEARPVVYTVEQVAEIMHCGVNSVYRLIDSGALRSFVIGKKGKRITERALLAYMEGVEA